MNAFWVSPSFSLAAVGSLGGSFARSNGKGSKLGCFRLIVVQAAIVQYHKRENGGAPLVGIGVTQASGLRRRVLRSERAVTGGQ